MTTKKANYWKRWIKRPENKVKVAKIKKRFKRKHPTYMRDYMRQYRAKKKTADYQQSLNTVKQDILKETN